MLFIKHVARIAIVTKQCYKSDMQIKVKAVSFLFLKSFKVIHTHDLTGCHFTNHMYHQNLILFYYQNKEQIKFCLNNSLKFHANALIIKRYSWLSLTYYACSVIYASDVSYTLTCKFVRCIQYSLLAFLSIYFITL